jgi:hypothetical protein
MRVVSPPKRDGSVSGTPPPDYGVLSQDSDRSRYGGMIVCFGSDKFGRCQIRKRARARAELVRLLRRQHTFRVRFSKRQAAASLWDYGEDALAARAIEMSDEDLSNILAIAGWYLDADYPLPLVGQHITHNHVHAFAAITFFEGEVRPLSRSRRRPQKDRPPIYAPQPLGPEWGSC